MKCGTGPVAWWLPCLFSLACQGAALLGLLSTAEATPPALPGYVLAPPLTAPLLPLPELTLEQAVRQALSSNPELAALRQQHGIAAAGLVIARTYPYNPVTQSTVLAVTGPEAAAVTNPVANQHKITIDVEIRGQRHFRRQAAFAALTRTDWEIATQEVTFAVNAVRAFDALLHRQAKLRLTEEFLRLNERGVEQTKQLVERGTLGGADLILARAEVRDVQAQVGLNRTLLVSVRRDLSRALGATEGNFVLRGALDRAAPAADAGQLLEAALVHRPELFARSAAVEEAQARARLQVADRWGNPTVGPVYEYNESRSHFIGVQFGIPIPIFNRRQGEVQQLQAQQAQAVLYLRQIEVDVRRDVLAAASRLAEAQTWAESYRKEILPDLRRSLDEIERLFREGQPGVGVLQVLDVRRRLLRAQDGHLDALLAYAQALADLAAAVGDPSLAMGLYQGPAGPPGPSCP